MSAALDLAWDHSMTAQKRLFISYGSLVIGLVMCAFFPRMPRFFMILPLLGLFYGVAACGYWIWRSSKALKAGDKQP